MNFQKSQHSLPTRLSQNETQSNKIQTHPFKLQKSLGMNKREGEGTTQSTRKMSQKAPTGEGKKT